MSTKTQPSAAFPPEDAPASPVPARLGSKDSAPARGSYPSPFMLSLGFGAAWGIQLTVLFSRTLFSPTIPRGADGFNYALGIGLALACLAIYLFDRLNGTTTPRLVTGPLAWGHGAVLALGAGAVLLSAQTGVESLRIVSGLLFGIGLGLGYICWMYRFPAILGDSARKALTWALAVGLIIFAALGWANYLVRIVALALLAAVSGATCFLFSNKPHTREESATDPAVARIDNIMMCAAVFAVATVYGISGNASLNSTSVIQGNTILWHFVLAAGATVLLAALGRYLPRKSNVTLLFRVVFPLVMLALVLLPFSDAWYLDFYSFTVAEAYQFMEVLLFFTFATLTVDVARIEALCLPLSSMWLATTVGVYIGSAIFGSNPGWTHALALLAVVAFFLMSMMLFALSVLMERRAAAAGNAQTTATEPIVTEGETAETKNLNRACTQIAARFDLTEREQEILGYLARGRSGTFIAEKLFLSPNTVKSYTRDMYTKLGVHSKQELIDLVETTATK